MIQKVGTQSFKSKKHLKAYVKELLRQHRLNLHETYKIREEYKPFLLELIKRNPYYNEINSDSGITDFYVTPNPRSYKFHHVFIVRNDDTKCDISINRCVTGLVDTENSIHSQVLRNAVREQISQFRNSIADVCECCLTENECFEIDHYDIEFKDLVKNFKKKVEMPKEYENHPEFHHKIFKKKNLNIKNEWLKFHEENAKLQKLCKNCHNNKTYKTFIEIS